MSKISFIEWFNTISGQLIRKKEGKEKSMRDIIQIIIYMPTKIIRGGGELVLGLYNNKMK